MEALRARIEGHLASFDRIALETGGRRRAAVAIVLSPTEKGPAWLLTRRALHMRRGAGNYALPGGNVDPGEDAVDTALRETHEELGVILARECALGLLDDFVTLGGHVVTPVVLWTPTALTLTPNPDEVPDGGPSILRMYARGSWINPPTAAWLYQFREVCLHGRLVRTDAIGQPNWTAN